MQSTDRSPRSPYCPGHGTRQDSANFFASALSDWQVQSIGDFNGDGRDDIMWRHTNGSMTNWLGMANGGMNTNNSANFFTVLASQWHVQPEGLLV